MTWYPIRELRIYPIKGCRGISVQRAKAEKRGFAMDRRFMFVDKRGKFLSQRKDPALAQVSVSLDGDGLSLSHEEAGATNVAFPSSDADIVDATLWRDEIGGLLCDLDPDWIRAVLGRDARLVYQPPDMRRTVDPQFGRATDVVSYADAFPYLITNEASLWRLNEELDAPVVMDNFRPNIVISGAVPFEENNWTRLRVEGVEYELTKPCTRCVVITTDQQSGERDRPDVLKELAKLSRTSDGVVFGQQGMVRGRGWLQVHDIVEVL